MAKKKHRWTAKQRAAGFGGKRRKRSKSVAKKRKSKSRRRRPSHHGGRRHRRGGRRRSSGGGGWLPAPVSELVASAALGFVEAKAKADAAFVLNKIPRPVAQLGYTGGTALAAMVVYKFTGNRYARMIAHAAGMATAYQIAKQGGLFTSSDATSIAGPNMLAGGGENMMGVDHYINDHSVGALATEGPIAGVPPEQVHPEGSSY